MYDIYNPRHPTDFKVVAGHGTRATGAESFKTRLSNDEVVELCSRATFNIDPVRAPNAPLTKRLLRLRLTQTQTLEHVVASLIWQ